MRFHMGISFRFKTLKKFLIPFLIGLLSYFGFSYFNMLVVNAAWNNPSTYFTIDIPSSSDIDFPNIMFGNYTLDQFINGGYNSNNYKIIPVVKYDKTTHITTLYIIYANSGSTYADLSSYAQVTSNGSQFKATLKSSTSSLRVSTISSNYSVEQVETAYNSYVSCSMNSNGCPSTSINSYTFSLDVTGTVVDGSDLDLNTSNIFYFIYKSPIPVRYQRNTSTNNLYFYKSLKYNGQTILYGNQMPYYMDSYIPPTPGGLFWEIDDLKPIDDFFVSKVDVNDIDELEIDIRFKYYDNNMVDDLDFDTYYYGRVDNGNYYSYEKINCLRDGAITYDYDINNNYKVIYSNFRCSSSLTNYDYIYIRFRPRYINTTNNKISNIYMSSSSGYMNQTKEYNGGNFVQIMDYFDNLDNNFEMLISTNKQRQYSNYYSLDSTIIMSNVNRQDNNISNFASDNNMLFGTETNSNVIIYNIDLNNNNLNPLYVYIGDESIISFRDTNTNTFTYYDDTNTLVQGNIDNNFQVVYNSYDLNYYFSRVNNFINDIDNDLISFHNLIQTCYDSLDVSIQLIINVLYILGLSYLLFKALRK